MSHCLYVTLSVCHTVCMSHCLCVTLSVCRTVCMSHCLYVTLSVWAVPNQWTGMEWNGLQVIMV